MAITGAAWRQADQPATSWSGGGPARPFLWQSRFLLSHLRIDADHIHLFDRLSRLQQRLAEHCPAEECETRLTRMLADMERHMATEEEVMAAAGYPDLAGHARLHRTLKMRARATLDLGRGGGWEIAVRLLSWTLLEHIAVEDARLRPVVGGIA